ncbi:FCD domain protein [Mycobacterium xenopi 4042]|uniref:FCD domain protein n=1 Tax=Mycobacterium xenopi 4042 TaxID=1299334 RepID=X8DN80_MYCXE|nr:FCD domain protein [Mycobacterium xenopi 4042]
MLQDSLSTLEIEDDPTEWQRQALTFWDHVLDGAGSIVFRLMFNAFRGAYEPALPMLSTVMTSEIRRPGDYRKLADAISVGDSAAAKKAAYELIECANEAVMAALDKLESKR